MGKKFATWQGWPDEDARPGEAGPTDLREIRERDRAEAHEIEWGQWRRLDQDGYETGSYNHYLLIDGRIGIEDGADSQWADATSAAEGIKTYLNDPEEWERRM